MVKDKYFKGDTKEPKKLDEKIEIRLREGAIEIAKNKPALILNVERYYIDGAEFLSLRLPSSIHYNEEIKDSDGNEWEVSGTIQKDNGTIVHDMDDLLNTRDEDLYVDVYINPKWLHEYGLVFFGQFRVLSKFINMDNKQCILVERIQ